jgi:hypothetical protein
MRARVAISSREASGPSSHRYAYHGSALPRGPRLWVRLLALLAGVLGADAVLAVPRFTSTPVTTANEDANYRYEIRTADPQGGLRRVTAPLLPAWLSLTNERLTNGSARLSGTPTQAHVGTHSITLEVTSLFTNATAVQSFSITVVNTNDAPIITGQVPNPIPLAAGAALTIQLSHLIVTDVDNVYPTGFTLTVQNGSNYTRSNATITPTASFTGVLTVPVRVNDGIANSNTFNVRVAVSASANRPPEIIGPIPSQLGTENTPFQLRNASGAPTSLAAFFRDLDAGDTLRYEATGLPASGNLVLNATTGEITGVPRAIDTRATPYMVEVTATDNKILPSERPRLSFDLTLAPPNSSDVALKLAVTPAPALTNAAVRWVFTITNNGPQPAGSIDLIAEFAGNPFAFTALAGCSVTPVADRQRLTCTVPTLAAKGTADIAVTGQAAQGGDISVTAEVAEQRSDAVDPNRSNNRDSATLNVAQQLSSGPAQILPSSGSVGVAAGDVDGDGFVDLALAKSAGDSAEIYLNIVDPGNGARRRLAETPMAVGDATSASDVALADLDGDSDLDMVLANGTGQPNRIFRNAGTAVFTLLATLGTDTSNAVAVADFDVDGFADIVFANSGPNAVYRSQAGSAFALRTTLDNDDSRDVLAVDLDLDNLPDLVFANANGPSRFYRNIGAGAFAAGVVIDTGGAQAVASGDFNKDGRPDLVFARRDATSGVPSNPVYQNNPGVNGGPLFVLVATLGASPTIDTLAADVDDDGATDVIVMNATGTHQVYRGNGAGGFTLHPVQFTSTGAAAAALGKFSVDASVDLAVAATTSAAAFFNDGRGGFGVGNTALPAIQMLGAATVTVVVGAPYQDAGATATDDVDGNLTASIVTRNQVDTAVVGDYSVTYDVMDSSGNAAVQVMRDVRVAAREGTGGGGGGATGALMLACLAVALCVARRRERTPSRGARTGS